MCHRSQNKQTNLSGRESWAERAGPNRPIYAQVVKWEEKKCENGSAHTQFCGEEETTARLASMRLSETANNSPWRDRESSAAEAAADVCSSGICLHTSDPRSDWRPAALAHQFYPRCASCPPILAERNSRSPADLAGCIPSLLDTFRPLVRRSQSLGLT